MRPDALSGSPHKGENHAGQLGAHPHQPCRQPAASRRSDRGQPRRKKPAGGERGASFQQTAASRGRRRSCAAKRSRHRRAGRRRIRQVDGARVNYGSWRSYSLERLGGLEHDDPPDECRRGGRARAIRADQLWRPARPHAIRRRLQRPRLRHHHRPAAVRRPICVGPVTYIGHDAIKADIAHFKAALERRRDRGRLHDGDRAGQRRADRQHLLQDRRRVPVRLRRRDARGIQGDRRCRPRPAARRPGDRRELGPDRSRADRRGLQELHHASGSRR